MLRSYLKGYINSYSVYQLGGRGAEKDEVEAWWPERWIQWAQETPNVETLIISTWPKIPAPHRHPFGSHLVLLPRHQIPNLPGSEACVGQQKWRHCCQTCQNNPAQGGLAWEIVSCNIWLVQKARMSGCHAGKASICLTYAPLLSPSHGQMLPALDLSCERLLS